MGDLARTRRQRDVHLSRGHLVAGMAGVMLLSATSFALGHHLGSQDRTELRALGFAGGAPQEGLVELLARVDSSGDTTGGVDTLTFPEALTRSSGGGVVDVDPRPAGSYVIEVGSYHDVADARTLREHLRNAGMEAWIGAELEAGVMSWRVSVGGYSEQADAEEGMGSLSAALEGWSAVVVQPRILGP